MKSFAGHVFIAVEHDKQVLARGSQGLGDVGTTQPGSHGPGVNGGPIMHLNVVPQAVHRVFHIQGLKY